MQSLGPGGRLPWMPDNWCLVIVIIGFLHLPDLFEYFQLSCRIILLVSQHHFIFPSCLLCELSTWRL